MGVMFLRDIPIEIPWHQTCPSQMKAGHNNAYRLTQHYSDCILVFGQGGAGLGMDSLYRLDADCLWP